MKEYNNFSQGSAEWIAHEIGKISGTRLAKVFSSSADELIDLLIAEEGTNQLTENYVSADMIRGLEFEPFARKMFEKVHQKVDELGICISDQFPYLVCSPDGFSPDRTIGIEIKCSRTHNHVACIRKGKIPSQYVWQVVNYFLVNEKCEKMYFISFDERFKPMPYFEIMVTRSAMEKKIAEAVQTLPVFRAQWNALRKVFGFEQF